MSRPINCDQVSWMLDAIRRYLPKNNHPRISRERDVLAYGLLYEIMEAACLHFEDDGAAQNATPRDVFLMREKESPLRAGATAEGLNRLLKP